MSKNLAFGLGAVAIVASILMFVVGTGSPNLSELKDLFWVPLPLGVIFFLIGMKK